MTEIADADNDEKKHAGGRPLLFETVEELQEKIQAYFNDCLPHPEERVVFKWKQKTVTRKVRDPATHELIEKEFEEDDRSLPPDEEKEWYITEPKRMTISALAVWLKTSRLTLINYEIRPEFFNTVKEAKDIIESEWEDRLVGANVTGVIFNLKNNWKWQDKTEQEITNPDGSFNAYHGLSTDELRALAKKS